MTAPFIISGFNGRISTSADGITWTGQTSGFGASDINSAVWSPGLSLWVAVGGAGKLATSPDSVTWTQRTSGFSSVEDIVDVAWSPELNLFVAVGGKPSNTPAGPPNSRVATSPDGITWTMRASASGYGVALTRVAWSPALSLFVIAGGGAAFATSPDGITWTQRTSGFGASPIGALAWSPTLSLFVIAGGGGGKLATSPNGITWTMRTSGTTKTFFDMTWSNELGLFVGVGTQGLISTSPDGIAWTLRSSFIVSASISGVAWHAGAGLFVAGGSDGYLISSPDGITWTQQTSGYEAAGDYILAVTAGPTASFEVPTHCPSGYGEEWSMLMLPPGGDGIDHSLDDLSTWPQNPMPAGVEIPSSSGTEEWSPIATSVPVGTPNTVFWIARVTDSRPLSLELRVDAYVMVYHNGYYVGAYSTAGATYPSSVPTSVFFDLSRLPGQIAIRVEQKVRAGLDGLYIDPRVICASVTPVVRQYPREDGAGLSAAPRLYPPPKRQQRVVGGYQ